MEKKKGLSVLILLLLLFFIHAAAQDDQEEIRRVVSLVEKGNSYLKANKHKEAKDAFQVALTIYRQWAEENPKVILPGMARTMNHLGLVFTKMMEFPDALEAHKEARKIMETLARKNPDAYQLKLCKTLIPIAMISVVLADETSVYTELPGIQQDLERAISILEQYPESKEARKLLKEARETMKILEALHKQDWKLLWLVED